MMMKQQAMFKNMSNEPLANRLRPTTVMLFPQWFFGDHRELGKQL